MDILGSDKQLSPQKWARFLVTHGSDPKDRSAIRPENPADDHIEVLCDGIDPYDVDGRVRSRGGWGAIPWKYEKDHTGGRLIFHGELLDQDEIVRQNGTMAFELYFKKEGTYHISAYSSEEKKERAIRGPAMITMIVRS